MYYKLSREKKNPFLSSVLLRTCRILRIIKYIYPDTHTHTHIYIYLYRRVNICRTAFKVLNSKLERNTVDVKQINSTFDLASYYYLVSYNTTCVLHSSDKIAKCVDCNTQVGL